MLPRTVLLTLASSLLALAAPQLQPAAAISSNPNDVVYRADFPTGNSQTVVGVIQFYSLNGTTKVHVDVTGLPKNSGLFSYHIHDGAVGASNKCDKNSGHFNPYNAPKDCDAQLSDAYCALGDLSGKHGLINTTCFETSYFDPYLSLNPSSPQFIGGKSINIHLVDKNEDILACATIKPSREPEDLLLLNKKTKVQGVPKKYEELSGAGIQTYEDKPELTEIFEEARQQVDAAGYTEGEGQLNPLSPRAESSSEVDDEEEYVEETEDAIQEIEEDAKDDDAEENDAEEEDDDDDDDDDDEKDLNKLIDEDLGQKKSLANTSNLTYNASNLSGAGEEENSAALNANLGFATISGAFVAALFSFLF